MRADMESAPTAHLPRRGRKECQTTLVGASIARPCPFVCEKLPGKRVTVPSWRTTNGRPYTFNRPRMWFFDNLTSLPEGGFLFARILQNKNNMNRFVIFCGPSAQKRRARIGKSALNGENFPLLSVKFHLVFCPAPEYYNNCQQGPHLYRGPKKSTAKRRRNLL